MNESHQEFSPRRKHQLEILQRYLHTKSAWMLILGASGVGKSYLTQQLMARVQTDYRIILVQAHEDLEALTLAKLLAQHCSLTINVAESEYREIMNNVLVQLAELEQPSILIVEDAHLLPLSTLSALVYLVYAQAEFSDIRLHLLLIGVPDLLSTLNTLHSGNIPHLTMDPLSHKETFAFMLDCLDVWGYKNNLDMDDEIVTQIFVQSGGFPNVVKQLTWLWVQQQSQETEEIFNVEKDDIYPEKSLQAADSYTESVEVETILQTATSSIIPERRFNQKTHPKKVVMPVEKNQNFWERHGVKTFAVLGLVILGVILFCNKHLPTDESLNIQQTATTDANSDTVETASSTTNANDVHNNEVAQEEKSTSSPASNVSADAASIDESTSTSAQNPTEAVKNVSEEASGLTEPNGGENVANTVSNTAQEFNPLNHEPAAANNENDAVSASAMSTQTNPPLASERAESRAKPQHAQFKSAIGAKKTPVQANPVKAHSITPPAREKLKTHSPHVIVHLTRKFTLQLAASSQRPAIEHFIQLHHLQHRAQVIEFKKNHKNWYGAAFGCYNSKQGAQLALHGLSPNLKKLHPWIKQLG